MTEEKIMQDASAIILACKKMLALAAEHIAFDAKRPLVFRFGDKDIDITIKEKLYCIMSILLLTSALAAQPSFPLNVRVNSNIMKDMLVTVPSSGLLVLGVNKNDIEKVELVRALDDSLEVTIKAKVWQSVSGFPDFLFLQEDSVYIYEVEASPPVEYIQLFSSTNTPLLKGTSTLANVEDLGLVNFKQYKLHAIKVYMK